MAVRVRSTPPRRGRKRAVNGVTPAPDPVERVVSVGFLLAAIAVAVQTVAHLTNAFALDYEIWNMDAAQDGNALSWASSVATFTAALGAFLLALTSSRPLWRFFALAAIFTFFSVDDVIALHEKLAFGVGGDLGFPKLLSRGLWPLLYFPLFAVAALMLWRLSASTQDRIRLAIRLGLALLAVALAAEVVATLWWSDDSSFRPLYDDLEIAVEEGAELAGWILIATGLLALACAALGRLQGGGELPTQPAGGGPPP